MDVPQHVRSRTDRPIVLAYKFLSPRQSIVLCVLRHEEVQTLQSVVDSALYQVLVLDTQKMHQLTLVLQNTHRQYMSVGDVPAGATLWSLRVNSMTMQPVRGRNDTLLVPLLAGSRQSEDGLAMRTSVEISWMTGHEPLGPNGSLTLSPPRLDMPISKLSVDVQLPENLDANFTGSIRDVSKFSYRQPHAVNYETQRHVTETNHKFGAAEKPAVRASLQAKVPTQGMRYRFEKILVVGDGASLSASYALRPSEAGLTIGRDWFSQLPFR